MRNIDLAKTQITASIRVSTAAIWREEHFGKYFIVETWIFSDDPRQKSRQIIHGTPSEFSVSQALQAAQEPPEFRTAQKVHRQIANNLKAIYQTP